MRYKFVILNYINNEKYQEKTSFSLIYKKAYL